MIFTASITLLLLWTVPSDQSDICHVCAPFQQSSETVPLLETFCAHYNLTGRCCREINSSHIIG